AEPAWALDMRDLSLRFVEIQLRDMASQLERAQRVFLALRSTSENPTAVLAARAADAAVLCVELGKTNIKDAVKTVEDVGRDSCVGTILVSGVSIRVGGGGAPGAADPGRTFEVPVAAGVGTSSGR